MKVESLGKVEPAEFGFSEVVFDDELGESCAIQTVDTIAHMLDESAPKSLIIGVKNPHCYIHEKFAGEVGIKDSAPDERGLVVFDLPDQVIVGSSIQLTEVQVRAMIERLNQWLEHGEFYDEK